MNPDLLPRTQPQVLALFSNEPPVELVAAAAADARVAADVLEHWPPFFDPDSELSLLLTPEERSAAGAARGALLLSFEAAGAASSWLPAGVEYIRQCHAHGALAVVLPAARKAIGPSALAALAPALETSAGRAKLLVQFHVVQDEEHAWSHTHGMAHYGLPDLECRTTRADCLLAERLLQAGIAHLFEHGSDSLEPGSLIEATEPDGRFLARLRIRSAAPVEGHAYDAWGALELVPLAPGRDEPGSTEDYVMDARSQLSLCVANRQRARDLNLREARLARLDLSGMSGDRLDLSRADLAGAVLRGARLGGCRFDAAHMEETEWSGAILRTCSLDGASAAGARFEAARIEDSSVKGADLTRARLVRAQVTDTSFERAILRGAVLEETAGVGVEFRGADLSGASLAGARLDEADFRGADLRHADLARGRFRGADFRGALMDGARLDDADFAGARFDAGESPCAEPAAPNGTADPAGFDRAALASLRDGLAVLQRAYSGDIAASNLPQELRQWLGPLVEIAEGRPPGAFLEEVERILDAMDTTSGEPPAELQPALEPLVKMLNDGRAPDPKMFLDALSALAGNHPAQRPASRK